MFGSQKTYSIAEVTDGTSNTIAMSERLCEQRSPRGSPGPATVGARQVEHVMAVAIGVGGLRTAPNVCRTTTDGKYYVAGTPVQGRWGIVWTDGQPMYVGINTVLPPNAPACSEDSSNYGDQVHLVLPPNSRHPGGVNCVFVDGSVRFISETIETGNLAAGVTQTRNGPSLYGVWGALGSKDGGETVSTP